MIKCDDVMQITIKFSTPIMFETRILWTFEIDHKWWFEECHSWIYGTPLVFNKTTVKFSCCLVGRMAGLFRDKGHQCQNFDTFLVLTWPLCCSVKDNIHECWIFGTPFLTTVNFWGCLARRMTDLFRDNRHQIHYKALVIVCLSVTSNYFLEKSLLSFQLPFCWKLDHCELLRLLGKGNDRPVQGQQTPMSLQGLDHRVCVSVMSNHFLERKEEWL